MSRWRLSRRAVRPRRVDDEARGEVVAMTAYNPTLCAALVAELRERPSTWGRGAPTTAARAKVPTTYATTNSRERNDPVLETLDEAKCSWTQTAATYARAKQYAIIAAVGCLILLTGAIILPWPPLWSCAVLGLLSGAALGRVARCERYRKGALRVAERLNQMSKP